MNGIHDLGGMHGMGPVAPEADEPIFHAAWERRAFALTLAMGATGAWNLDMTRSAREQMAPGDYLKTSYYEHWLFGLETLLLEHGLASREEIEAGRGRRAPAPLPRVLQAADVDAVLRKGGSARMAAEAPARFRAGDAVRVRNLHPTGHTRVPRYVRGRTGTVEIDHGAFIFPDTHAAGAGRQPQRLYAVRFAARELWGPEACASDSVLVDLFDAYLEPPPA